MFRNGLTPETSLSVRAGRILLDKKGNGQQTLYQTTAGPSIYRRVAAYSTGEEQADERDALLRQCTRYSSGLWLSVLGRGNRLSLLQRVQTAL